MSSALAAGFAGCSESFPGDGQGTPGVQQSTVTPDRGEESAYQQVYDKTATSVALVRTPSRNLGSGWVYDDQGHVVTNAHVVGDSNRVELQFSRGQTIPADVVGMDKLSDLAVLNATERPSYATPLPLANSQPAIGTRVAVIGSPYALRGTLTSGIVSGVNRLLPNPRADFLLPNAIQTDAPVNPGNSGGPLVDLDGTVLGVVNSGGAENIAFAISAAMVQRVVPALIQDGEYVHPTLGVRTTKVTDTVARANNLEHTRGLLVVEADPEGPAAAKVRGSDSRTQIRGLTVPVGGDVILSIDGHEVSTRQDLISYVRLQTSPGETVSLTVLHDGERQTVKVELGRDESG